jgi:hypothetical protein
MGTLMDSLQNAGGCSGQASTAAQQQVSAGSLARNKGGSACAVQGVALGIGELGEGFCKAGCLSSPPHWHMVRLEATCTHTSLSHTCINLLYTLP